MAMSCGLQALSRVAGVIPMRDLEAYQANALEGQCDKRFLVGRGGATIDAAALSFIVLRDHM